MEVEIIGNIVPGNFVTERDVTESVAFTEK